MSVVCNIAQNPLHQFPRFPRALNAGINDPPKEWRRPRGRPRQTWLRTIKNDLKHQNLGLWSTGRPGTELMTVICGVISWKRRRSCRGMLHDDDDEVCNKLAASCLRGSYEETVVMDLGLMSAVVR